MEAQNKRILSVCSKCVCSKIPVLHNYWRLKTPVGLVGNMVMSLEIELCDNISFKSRKTVANRGNMLLLCACMHAPTTLAQLFTNLPLRRQLTSHQQPSSHYPPLYLQAVSILPYNNRTMYCTSFVQPDIHAPLIASLLPYIDSKDILRLGSIWTIGCD